MERRGFIAALALAPVAIAAPAVAQTFVCSPDPIAEYLAAFHGYDGISEASAERFDKAGAALNAWEPNNPTDMLRKVVVMLDDYGAAPETSMPKLIRQVDQLVSGRR